jgi:SAM-dependent methyltransferase
MRADLLAAITADLAEFQAEHHDPALHARLLEGLSRLVGTVDLIPEYLRGGDILQLGSDPFVLTLCLRRACSGRLTLANDHFGTAERRGEHELVNRRTGERLRFESDLFNLESEDFPYPDASFDVVVLSEILEHLAINPVRALAEIHRVLRPDGVLVLTTPNAISVQRFESFLAGKGLFVDRYSPTFGYGGRHNREYRPYELRELLESTGFVIEEFAIRDLTDGPWAKRLRHAVYRWLLARYSGQPHREHMFLRGRRLPRFRWSFPPSLFEDTDAYVLVRDACVRVVPAGTGRRRPRRATLDPRERPGAAALPRGRVDPPGGVLRARRPRCRGAPGSRDRARPLALEDGPVGGLRR